MRGFLILATSAVALSACAPFEHGHYANDVKYVNSSGDPAGTPLVFGIGESTSTQYAGGHSTGGHYAGGTKHWDHGAHYTQAASYAPVAPQPAYTPVSYPAPQTYTVASQSGYQPASQSTYGYSATTLGGIRFDSEGYAICEESHSVGAAHPAHGHHAAHGYATTYK